MNIVYVFVGALFSGITYYLGGQGGPWYKRSWIRDYICPLIVMAFLTQHSLYHWSLWLCYPLMIGACSTYWKKKGTDATWRNWFLHGLGIGLALIPYAIMIHQVIPIIARSILLGACMALWSGYIVVWLKSNVKWLKWNIDECGRGLLIIATLLIF